MRTDYDVLVIGSGFGGSVAALRLAEKGYRVGVLEAGRRFEPEDFPRTSWDVRRYLWAPRLSCHGILRLTLLDHALVLSGAGLGGGSLVYANVLHEPQAYDDGLTPFYVTVRRMLGASTVPFEAPADAVLRRVATQMGAGETYRPATVAVDFDRCIRCGGCMIGCRHGAKNTLDRNYLRLAETQGARLLTGHEVRRIRAAEGAWEAETARGSVSGAQVVLAAGVLGTLPLLFGLPRVPLRTGFRVRTNTETLVGATAGSSDTDYSEGVAIGSSFRPDDSSEVQAVRYPRGSNAMALLGRPLLLRHWAERATILLCMGTETTPSGSCRADGGSARSGERRIHPRSASGLPRPRWASRPRSRAAGPAAFGSIARSRHTSWAAPASGSRATRASSTATTVSSVSPGSTSSTARRSARTWASTPR
jgi:cholesterol oxidase